MALHSNWIFLKNLNVTISNVYISFMYLYANIYQDGDAGRGGSNSMVDRKQALWNLFNNNVDFLRK